MALSWDLTKVANHDDVCWVESDKDIPELDIKAGDSYMSPTTNHLIWMTIAVGIGDLNEKTAPEFYARLKMLALLDGHNEKVTAQDIQNHIGLTCNVSYETKASWLKRVTARDYDKLLAQYGKETEG